MVSLFITGWLAHAPQRNLNDTVSDEVAEYMKLVYHLDADLLSLFADVENAKIRYFFCDLFLIDAISVKRDFPIKAVYFKDEHLSLEVNNIVFKITTAESIELLNHAIEQISQYKKRRFEVAA